MAHPYDKKIKLIVTGNSGTGKSSMALRFVHDKFVETPGSSTTSTVGADVLTRIIEFGGKKIKLAISDTAGQEQFRSITTSHYRDTHGAFVVFDITDEDSFKTVKLWMKEVERYAPEDVVRMIVGNKCDLVAERKVSSELGRQLAAEHNVTYIETSAKNSINIEEAFTQLTMAIMPRLVQQAQETTAPASKKKSKTSWSRSAAASKNGVIKLGSPEDEKNRGDTSSCCGGQKNGKRAAAGEAPAHEAAAAAAGVDDGVQATAAAAGETPPSAEVTEWVEAYLNTQTSVPTWTAMKAEIMTRHPACDLNAVVDGRSIGDQCKTFLVTFADHLSGAEDTAAAAEEQTAAEAKAAEEASAELLQLLVQLVRTGCEPFSLSECSWFTKSKPPIGFANVIISYTTDLYTKGDNGGELLMWKVSNALKARGISSFNGKLVPGGTGWLPGWFGNLPESAVVLLMLSKRYFHSSSCIRELLRAFDDGGRAATGTVLPIYLDDLSLKHEFMGSGTMEMENATTTIRSRLHNVNRIPPPDPKAPHGNPFQFDFEGSIQALTERVQQVLQHGACKKTTPLPGSGSVRHNPVTTDNRKTMKTEPLDPVLHSSYLTDASVLVIADETSDHTAAMLWPIINSLGADGLFSATMALLPVHMPPQKKLGEMRRLLEAREKDGSRRIKAVVVLVSESFVGNPAADHIMLLNEACQAMSTFAQIVPVHVDEVDLHGHFFGVESREAIVRANFLSPAIAHPVHGRGVLGDNYDGYAQRMLDRVGVLVGKSAADLGQYYLAVPADDDNRDTRL